MKYSYDVRIGLCAYVDILGTKERLVRLESDSDLIHDIVKEVERVRASAFALKDAHGQFISSDFTLRHYLFSDSHIFCFTDIDRPSKATGQATRLYGAAGLLLANLQLDLISTGLFVRGGMALGGMALSEHNVIGTPVGRSVYLEENVSDFPCITVCDGCEADLISCTKYWKEDNDSSHFSSYYVRRHCDGRIVINPFAMMLYYKGANEKLTAFSQRYLTTIANQLRIFQDNE